MSRPKQCAYENSAKGKIESAFWSILEKEGFHAVTMLRLSQESGLNRNTIYYHFDNVQEVSRFAFNHIFTQNAGKLFASVILSGNEISPSVMEDTKLLSNVKKIHLFARSDSPLLIHILKDSMKKAWFSTIGISGETLTSAEKMQIEYILSGFIGIIGNEEFTSNFSILKSFPRTAIGKVATDTLMKIAVRQHTPGDV